MRPRRFRVSTSVARLSPNRSSWANILSSIDDDAGMSRMDGAKEEMRGYVLNTQGPSDLEMSLCAPLIGSPEVHGGKVAWHNDRGMVTKIALHFGSFSRDFVSRFAALFGQSLTCKIAKG